MKAPMCPGQADMIRQDAKRETYEGMNPDPYRARGVKRIKMKCELCGRRVASSVSVDHDGDYIWHSIPPHKERYWWKKKGRKHVS